MKSPSMVRAASWSPFFIPNQPSEYSPSFACRKPSKELNEMKIKTLVEELEKRRAIARAGGGQDKLDARRKKGVMTARDRIDGLFQAGTFQESGLHAEHDCHNFGMEEKSLPSDGVVTGTGIVDGRVVA